MVRDAVDVVDALNMFYLTRLCLMISYAIRGDRECGFQFFGEKIEILYHLICSSILPYLLFFFQSRTTI